MVHAIVLEAYIHFSFMYKAYHIFPVLPIKDLINKYGEPPMPFKLSTGTKPQASYLRVLFCPCVVRKSTAHIGTKALNRYHQAQKVFRGISVGIPQHKKAYIMNVPGTRKIISSYDDVFYEKNRVRWNIRHNYMQKQWICIQLCHTHLMLHLQGN